MNHRFLLLLLCLVAGLILAVWQAGKLAEPEITARSGNTVVGADAEEPSPSPARHDTGGNDASVTEVHPDAAPEFIDGHGPLDFERWGELIRSVDGTCESVMRPDIATVVETLRQRYEAGEHEAAVFLAGVFSCESYFSRPGYQHEQQLYWAKKAAGHDLAEGHEILAMLAINRMMGYIKGMPEPGPMEMERLKQTWHESVLDIYEDSGKAEDLWALASSYSHTYGPLFDEKKAKYWLREWADIASAKKVASVGRSLISRGQGGYANSTLGSEFLLQAGRDGQPGAMINLMEFVSACQGPPPQAGLPSVREIHEEYVELHGNSARAAIALATALASEGDYNEAYAAIIEAQSLQQAAAPNDIRTQQQLVDLAARVRQGNAMPTIGDAGRPCDPPGQYPEDE